METVYETDEIVVRMECAHRPVRSRLPRVLVQFSNWNGIETVLHC